MYKSARERGGGYFSQHRDKTYRQGGGKGTETKKITNRLAVNDEKSQNACETFMYKTSNHKTFMSHNEAVIEDQT
jgi:hypothetical protein